jgi:hypothetical protein
MREKEQREINLHGSWRLWADARWSQGSVQTKLLRKAPTRYCMDGHTKDDDMTYLFWNLIPHLHDLQAQRNHFTLQKKSDDFRFHIIYLHEGKETPFSFTAFVFGKSNKWILD